MKRASYALAVLFAAVAMLAFAQRADARTIYIDRAGIYTDDVVIPAGTVVRGDLTLLGSNATIDGRLIGNVNAIGGNVDARPGSITGEQNQIGDDFTASVLPWSYAHRTQSHVTWSLLTGVIVLLFFLIFPARTRVALDRLERHPGLSVAIGLVGWVAVIPLAFVLFCTIVLIPLIFVEAVAVLAGVFIGTAALSLLVGRRLYEMLSPQSTASPIIALVLGLVLITAAELVPFLGRLVEGLIFLVGLGAAILAFVRESHFSGTAGTAPPPGPARPTISGPPMTLG